MGSSSSNTSQQSSQALAPYSPASGYMNGALGELGSMVNSGSSLNAGQSGALNQIISNANGTPNFQPQINTGTVGLLNGGGAQANDGAITGAIANYQAGMSPYTNPNYSTVNSAPVRAALDQIATDTTNNVNGSFAAAGRVGSPGNTQALARGIASAEAPIILSQANQDTATRQNALGSVFGNTTSGYGILNGNRQTANQNFGNGVASIGAGVSANNAAPSAALQAASDQFGIPVSQLQTLLGTISPIAQAFGTQSGTSNGTTTNNPSLLSEIAGVANMFGSKSTSPVQGMANFGSGILNGFGSMFGA